MPLQLEESWKQELQSEFEKPYIKDLRTFLAKEKQEYAIFPLSKDLFKALDLTPFPQVKVVILGQDPYHTPSKAHGLAFSVPKGVSFPPSLENIFQELHNNIGCPFPKTGDLSPWATQGVLLLNTVLTVRKGQANSHKNQGWERFTDCIIERLSLKKSFLVFLLWGRHAQSKLPLIDQNKHQIIQAGHPSPFSVHLFFGHKPFSRTNEILHQKGQTPIQWCL